MNIDDIDTDAYDIIIISDYNHGVVHNPHKLITRATCPVIADPKGMDWSKYTGAYCLKPNRQEFEEVCGELTVNNVRRAIKKYSLKAMIVTLDEEGVTFINEDEEIHIKAKTTEVKDVTGAGDTFIAVFASYFDADNIVRTLDIANTAAGISVSKFGTYAVTKDDLMQVRDYFWAFMLRFFWGKYHMRLACHWVGRIQVDNNTHFYFLFQCIFNI